MASQTSAPKRPYRETLEALVIAAIFLRFANTFVVQTFYIPSGSMEETMLVGDHLFVNRFVFGATASGLEERSLPHRAIERGDIVIFRSPEDPTIDIVKRCIGLPGDLVDVRGGELYLDGRPVRDGTFARHLGFVPGTPIAYRHQANEFGPYRVPEDHYFCMGDNRDQSYDSRFWGPVPRELVKGRAFMIYWSNEGETPDGRRETWGKRLARIGKTLVLFPVNTRWERTFQIIR